MILLADPPVLIEMSVRVALTAVIKSAPILKGPTPVLVTGTNTEGSYTCSCHSGFEFGSDGESCIDINECLVGNGSCDHECLNQVGSFECRCRNGYRLANGGECVG
jgi:hypothetical protein